MQDPLADSYKSAFLLVFYSVPNKIFCKSHIPGTAGSNELTKSVWLVSVNPVNQLNLP